MLANSLVRANEMRIITATLYATEQAPTLRNCVATIRFATKTKTKTKTKSYRYVHVDVNYILFAKDGKIWLNQQQMAELFATSKQLISHHIINILKEKELEEISVVKQYLTTAADGKNYNVVFYSYRPHIVL